LPSIHTELTLEHDYDTTGVIAAAAGPAVNLAAAADLAAAVADPAANLAARAKAAAR